MKSRMSMPLFAGLTLALAFSGLVSLQGQNAAAAKPTVVAVVDIQKVFSNMKEKASMEAEITRQGEQFDKERQERQQELKQLQVDLNLLNPESDSYKATETKLEEKAIFLKAWQEFKVQQLEREKVIRMEGLYLKIVDAVARMAKKQGYGLVLTNDQTERLRGTTQQQMAAQINIRKVLFAAEQLDITDQVLQFVDNEFGNR